MHGALRPGGHVVVWDVDWATVSWHSEDPARMERVLRAWDEHLTHPSLPRTLGARLRTAGFSQVAAESHVFATTSLDPEAFGTGLRPALAEEFVAGRPEIGPEQAQAWAAEQHELGARGELFFGCTQFCFTAVREHLPGGAALTRWWAWSSCRARSGRTRPGPVRRSAARGR